MTLALLFMAWVITGVLSFASEPAFAGWSVLFLGTTVLLLRQIIKKEKEEA